jgi:hypothetical protein
MTSTLANRAEFGLDAYSGLDATEILSIEAIIVDAPTIRRHRLSNTDISH